MSLLALLCCCFFASNHPDQQLPQPTVKVDNSLPKQDRVLGRHPYPTMLNRFDN